MDVVRRARERASEAQRKRKEKRLNELKRSVTEAEGEAWALELDEEMRASRRTLDGPAYAQVMQGLHRMQERGATAEQERMYITGYGF